MLAAELVGAGDALSAMPEEATDGNAHAARTGADAGFTLLEVLVGFAIAAPVLAMLYGQGVLALSAGRTTASYQEAIARAQSHLDMMTGDALAAGELSGDDGGGFRWRTSVRRLGALPPTRRPGAGGGSGAGGGPVPRGTALYSVSVELSWTGTDAERAFALHTRRLGPADGALP